MLEGLPLYSIHVCTFHKGKHLMFTLAAHTHKKNTLNTLVYFLPPVYTSSYSNLLSTPHSVEVALLTMWIMSKVTSTRLFNHLSSIQANPLSHNGHILLGFLLSKAVPLYSTVQASLPANSLKMTVTWWYKPIIPALYKAEVQDLKSLGN